MVENGIALDGTLFGEPNEHAQLAAKAVGVNGLHCYTLIGGIDDHVVAVGILHGLRFLYLSVGNAQHAVNTFGQGASFILFDGACCDFVHISQCSCCDDRDEGQHNEHIWKC